jgi:hypothetical protein
MQLDESNDPMSRYAETLAYVNKRLGLHGRVAGSHLTSKHSMDNCYVNKLLHLTQEAQLGVVANRLINITQQGRHDSYPKRRDMTYVPELLAHGITVAFGHECVWSLDTAWSAAWAMGLTRPWAHPTFKPMLKCIWPTALAKGVGTSLTHRAPPYRWGLSGFVRGVMQQTLPYPPSSAAPQQRMA